MKTLEATRAPILTGFVLPALPGTNALAVVKTDTRLPAIAVAQQRKTIDEVRGIELAVAKADASATTSGLTKTGNLITGLAVAPGILMTGYGVLGLVIGGVGALCGTNMFDTDTWQRVGIFLASGPAAVAPALLARKVSYALARDQLVQLEDGAKAVLEQATRAEGLERAWIATRCATITNAHAQPQGRSWFRRGLDRIVDDGLGGFGRAPTLQTLRQVAELLSTVDDAHRKTAADMEAVLGMIFSVGGPSTFELERKFEGDIHKDFERSFERMLGKLEQLPPEARALLDVAIRDRVVLELAKNEGNHWRVQRFLNTLDGVPTVFAKTEVVSANVQDPSQLANLRAMRESSVIADAPLVIRRLTHQLELVSTKKDAPLVAAMRVKDAATAEHVAAHFEEGGYRAALLDWPNQPKVVVYDPLAPPADANAVVLA